MAEPPALEYRVLPNNGSGWYWEVVSQNREVIARWLAGTYGQARVDAMTLPWLRDNVPGSDLHV